MSGDTEVIVTVLKEGGGLKEREKADAMDGHALKEASAPKLPPGAIPGDSQGMIDILRAWAESSSEEMRTRDTEDSTAPSPVTDANPAVASVEANDSGGTTVEVNAEVEEPTHEAQTPLQVTEDFFHLAALPVASMVVINEDEVILGEKAVPVQSVQSDKEGRLAQAAKEFPAYEILDMVGGGRVADVFHVRERATENEGVIKVINENLEPSVARKLLFEEARAINELRQAGSENVPNFATNVSAERPAIFCEYGSISFTEKIKAGLSTTEIIHFFSEMCDIVDALHLTKRLHGDLKPDSFRIRPDPTGKTPGTLVLVDLNGFDDSDKLSPHSIVMSGSRDALDNAKSLYTPLWAAPEQLAGEPKTVSVDVYQLAQLLRHIITGEIPKLDNRTLPKEWKNTAKVIKDSLSSPAEKLRPDTVMDLKKGFLQSVVHLLDKSEVQREDLVCGAIRDSLKVLADDKEELLDRGRALLMRLRELEGSKPIKELMKVLKERKIWVKIAKSDENLTKKHPELRAMELTLTGNGFVLSPIYQFYPNYRCLSNWNYLLKPWKGPVYLLMCLLDSRKPILSRTKGLATLDIDAENVASRIFEVMRERLLMK